MSYNSQFSEVFEVEILEETPLELSNIEKLQTTSNIQLIHENHRARGVRESFKFELGEQVVNHFLIPSIEVQEEMTKEEFNFYPSDDTLGRFQHAFVQLEHLLYQQLETRNGRWF